MNSIPMANFENKYTVYSNGIIISHKENKPIKPTKNPNGYYKYTFCLNGKKEQKLIHQVIAKHFLPNPYNYIQVNHINGDKANNAVSNLEWISSSDNIQHSLQTGLRKGYMSYDDKKRYMEEILLGKTVREIAERIGRREEVLSKMCRETAKKEGKYEQWKTIMTNRRKQVALRNLPQNK